MMLEKRNTIIFYLEFFILSYCIVVNAEVIPGVVQLNNGTFDKIIPKHKVVVVKFDESYPYGEKQDVFKSLAAATLDADDFLLVEIQCYDYGDNENMDLAERFSVTKDQFPAYFMFLQGKTMDPIRYSGDVKKEMELRQWITRQSGIYIGLPSSIEELDKIMEKFGQADGKVQKDLVDEMKNKVNNYDSESKKSRGNIYVKTAEKMLEKGMSFAENELKRVEKLAEGKLSDKKKSQMKERINVLTSIVAKLKDEL